MKDLSITHKYVCIKFIHDDHNLLFHQSEYTQELLQEFRMIDYKPPRLTPLPPGTNLSSESTSPANPLHSIVEW